MHIYPVISQPNTAEQAAQFYVETFADFAPAEVVQAQKMPRPR